jgi:DNA topoisomerase I
MSRTKLVIVESPAKCSKIQSYLGDDYRVLATMGHIRALSEKLDAVGIDRDWEPIYEELSTKREAIARLRKTAKESSEVLLATDDDREGEGIAWHICHLLKLNPATTKRIVFHEITRDAIQSAVATPRFLDMHRVNAQQARSMLDLMVGFTISPVLWSRVAPKLSAGRCQTPALRLVVERDCEIETHTARNYWQMRCDIGSDLVLRTDKEFSEEEARSILVRAGRVATVVSVKERVSSSAAPAPLITSSLQQEASALHGLGPKQTMAAAQKLYEAGHITYMRTDNPQLSIEASAVIRSLVEERWGAEYVGPIGQHQVGASSESAATRKTAKKTSGAPDAQAAHEAIRPTHAEVNDLADVEHAQQVVYRLIWRRAVQSQMSAAKAAVRAIQVNVESVEPHVWNGEQSRPIFDGWKAVDQGEKARQSATADEKAWSFWTPRLAVGAKMDWIALTAEEIFTRPPGRYTEATLIRELEKRGIGRPSTFASLVSTLFDREYVEKTNIEGKPYETRVLIRKADTTAPSEQRETHRSGTEKNKVRATPLGVAVTESLERDFHDLFAYEFTARMESELDQVSTGTKQWKSVLQETWDTYKDRYHAAISNKGAKTQQVCGDCRVVQSKKGPLLVRTKADGTGDEFAQLPKGITAATTAQKLTPTLIEAAFKESADARNGERMFEWNGEQVVKKKGPYGFYAQVGDIRVPLKAEDTEETIVAKLEAKQTAFQRTVGEFVIRQGPYGLYFMKKPTGKAKPRFVSLHKDMNAETVTETELKELYAAPVKPKKRA